MAAPKRRSGIGRPGRTHQGTRAEPGATIVYRS
jgi:hypothetical protein